jgi:hypothetical protein
MSITLPAGERQRGHLEGHGARHITYRYSKAIEQFGDDNLTVRLGG